MHWDTFKQDNYSTVGGNGGCVTNSAYMQVYTVLVVLTL